MFNKTQLVLIGISAVVLGFSIYRLSACEISYDRERVVVFGEWSLKHGRVYSTRSEHEYRMKVFMENYEDVLQINKAGYSWKAGLNRFSDMTIEELQAKFGGYKPRSFGGKMEISKNKNQISDKKALEDLPDSVDWREKGIVSKVQDQQNCNAGWAFATISTLESKIAQETSVLYNLSVQELIDCSYSYGNHGCNSGFINEAYLYIHDKGISDASDYPFTGQHQDCGPTSRIASVDSYKDIPYKDNDMLKLAVSEGVVAAGIHADSYLYKYKSGVYHHFCAHTINHAVTIVGYGRDDFEAKDYWIVKNSWGESWGIGGYGLMYRAAGKHEGICGIAVAASYPLL